MSEKETVPNESKIVAPIAGAAAGVASLMAGSAIAYRRDGPQVADLEGNFDMEGEGSGNVVSEKIEDFA